MNNTICMLFSDDYKSSRNTLSSGRTLASVPFGGRYRLIDFTLSSLVNNAFINIGIITKDKYGSLLDHVGSGKDWDLIRKKGGLQILTPFTKEEYLSTRTRSKVDALIAAKGYIEHNKCDNVIISDTNIIANIEYRQMLDFHVQNNADITVLHKKNLITDEGGVAINIDKFGKINDATIFDKKLSGTTDQTLGVYIIKRDLLLKLLDRAYTFGWTDIDRDFVTRNISKLEVYGFEHKKYCAVINSVNDYYKASMDLFEKSIRDELFNKENPVTTRVKNSPPTTYGYAGKARNSFIADGCTINGEVDNCIIFRDVHIEEGAKLQSCIIMQHTTICKNATINCVITDKDVVVQENRTLSGYKSYPFVISKGTIA